MHYFYFVYLETWPVAIGSLTQSHRLLGVSMTSSVRGFMSELKWKAIRYLWYANCLVCKSCCM